MCVKSNTIRAKKVLKSDGIASWAEFYTLSKKSNPNFLRYTHLFASPYFNVFPDLHTESLLGILALFFCRIILFSFLVFFLAIYFSSWKRACHWLYNMVTRASATLRTPSQRLGSCANIFPLTYGVRSSKSDWPNLLKENISSVIPSCPVSDADGGLGDREDLRLAAPYLRGAEVDLRPGFRMPGRKNILMNSTMKYSFTSPSICGRRPLRLEYPPK